MRQTNEAALSLYHAHAMEYLASERIDPPRLAFLRHAANQNRAKPDGQGLRTSPPQSRLKNHGLRLV